MGSVVRASLLGILIVVCQGVLANGPDIRGADLSFSHPGYRESISRIWNFVSQDIAGDRVGQIVAPVLYLEPFSRAEQSAELTEWQNEWIVKSPGVWLEWTDIAGMPAQQVNQKWIRENLDTLYPFPVTFRGFHYDGTNRVQVNPDTTYFAFYQNDAYGTKRDLVGYGYYVTGHELAHHALAERGVPEVLHHCVYVTRVDGKPSVMERLVEFLVNDGLASQMVTFYGLSQEISLDPCGRLDEKAREKAFAYARDLQNPILTAFQIKKNE